MQIYGNNDPNVLKSLLRRKKINKFTQRYTVLVPTYINRTRLEIVVDTTQSAYYCAQPTTNDHFSRVVVDDFSFSLRSAELIFHIENRTYLQTIRRKTFPFYLSIACGQVWINAPVYKIIKLCIGEDLRKIRNQRFVIECSPFILVP